LNIGDDATGNLGGLEPRVKWQTAGAYAGFDVEVRNNYFIDSFNFANQERQFS
jgi:hypothetical protein